MELDHFWPLIICCCHCSPHSNDKINKLFNISSHWLWFSVVESTSESPKKKENDVIDLTCSSDEEAEPDETDKPSDSSSSSLDSAPSVMSVPAQGASYAGDNNSSKTTTSNSGGCVSPPVINIDTPPPPHQGVSYTPPSQPRTPSAFSISSSHSPYTSSPHLSPISLPGVPPSSSSTLIPSITPTPPPAHTHNPSLTSYGSYNGMEPVLDPAEFEDFFSMLQGMGRNSPLFNSYMYPMTSSSSSAASSLASAATHPHYTHYQRHHPH